ncbi:SGNH/GDSL hydrolase family protein [Methylomonas sp. EFPC1]|uniref:SGNH/GDSL hydrolase family protein n=1 Tax=Methylomonas sp. EFPC1 TaxID=2812647 RepID=UPI001968853F|nr:SGNH/GDSL hydrolase family protein [Methylomonas sp. EFPC1]QSB03246.1 SGNH/GDSL hydrolase family protein [Methylomonas sp. EFPC1]
MMKTLSPQYSATELLRAGEVLLVDGSALVEIESNGIKSGPSAINLSGSVGPFHRDVGIVISALTTQVNYSTLNSADMQFGAPYAKKIGFVASRTSEPTNMNGANRQIYARSKHWSYDHLMAVKLVYWNGYLENNAPYERLNIGPATWQAQVESAEGEIIGRVTWRGGASDSGQIPPGGFAISDWINLSRPIKNSEGFFVGQFQEGASSIVFTTNQGLLIPTGSVIPDSGECATFGVTTQNRIGIGGPFTTSSSANLGARPSAIIGWTKNRSIIIFGDSRQGGTSENTAIDYLGLSGELEPSLSKYFAIHKANYASCRATRDYNAQSARLKLAQYATDAIISLGINDAQAGIPFDGVAGVGIKESIIAIKDNLTAIGLPVWLSTVAPKTNVGNTITDAVANPIRVQQNTWVRTCPAGFSGVLDIDKIVSINDLWVAGYANDGLHETNIGTAAIRDSGLIKI